jgi:hypothetical protein
MPKNEHTLAYFKRYSKFYLLTSEDDNLPEEYRVCWRVEATDWVSMPGVFEITAVEYYANDDEDDIKGGIVGALIVEEEDPNGENVNTLIEGPTFIKPLTEYTFVWKGVNNGNLWKFDSSLPITVNTSRDGKTISIKWNRATSGTFELSYGEFFTKTIVVQSLF